MLSPDFLQRQGEGGFFNVETKDQHQELREDFQFSKYPFCLPCRFAHRVKHLEKHFAKKNVT